MSYFASDKVTLVNLKGANSSRKSTKMTYVVKYLYEIATETEVFPEGILFKTPEINYFYLGKFTPKKKIYVSLDSLGDSLGKIEERLQYMKSVIEKYDVKVILCEGFFNNKSLRMDQLSFLKDFKIDRYEYYFLFCDTREEQTKLMRERSQQYTMHNSVEASLKVYKKLFTALKEINDPDCIVERTDIFTPRDYFVKKFFGVNRDYEEKNSSLDDF